MAPLDRFEHLCEDNQILNTTNVENSNTNEVIGSGNVDINTPISAMNTLLQQNQALMQMMSNQSNSNCYNIMPDFSKTIAAFNGNNLSQSKTWLANIETTAQLHRWPAAFKLETAKNRLEGAARHCSTFIHEKNLTTLWQQMCSRVQQPKEELNVYFHEKIKLCQELRLEFDEQKEQVVVGLFSREMASMIMTESHLDVDDLYKDLVTYKRIIADRKQRQTRQNIMRTHNTTTAHPQKISHDALTYQIGDHVVIKNFDNTPGVNKKLIPTFKRPYVVKKVLPIDRYAIGDPPDFQNTQIPFDGVVDSNNMKAWSKRIYCLMFIFP
ncbi:hypothetical protein Trydic_g844 [Trypoxylus dichotomus]